MVHSRVDKFSGKKGDEGFGLWLADFQEATDDFSWSNDTCVKWFSWFVEGPAKATWQCTLYMGHGYQLRRSSKGSVGHTWTHAQLIQDVMNYNEELGTTRSNERIPTSST